MATETHIAGLDLEVDGRYLVQRCAWCGATLLAYDYQRIKMPPPWSKPATYRAGALVRFTYEGEIARWGEATLSCTVSEALDDETLPDDACARALPLEGAA